MKKVLRKLTLALVAIILAAGFASCGGKNPNNQPPYDPASPDSLKIVVSDLGFGVQWAYDIARAFMDAYPGKTVTVEATVMEAAIISQLEAGKHIGDVAMLHDANLWKKWRSGIMSKLDDVINSTPEGEEKTIYEKMNNSLIEAYRVADGHFYSIPWLNENNSIVYNATSLDKLLGKGNWTLPKTTYDLWKLCDRIKNAGGYGFVWNSAYLNVNTWMAQYNGIENNRYYLDGYYYNGTEWVLSDNAQCSEQNRGYLRALENLHKLVNQYSHQYARNMTHLYAQSAWAGIAYAGDKKLSVFMPNGDWAYNETLRYIRQTQVEVGFMLTPVISEIVETLELYNETVEYNALSEAKKSQYNDILNAIIDYIDGGEQGQPPAGVSENDLARVREARQILSSKCQAQAIIPSNSPKKELAKQFLIFMASDLAVEIFSNSTYGYSPYISPDNYQNINFGVRFMEEVKQALIAAPLKDIRKYTDIRLAGYTFPKVSAFDQGLRSKSAQEFYQNEVNRLKTEWQDILEDAGLA